MRWVAALGLGLIGPVTAPAWAQNASTGQTLYNKIIVTGQASCAASACHGSTPSRGLNKIKQGVSAATIKTGVASVGDMQFLSGHLTDSDFNDLAAYIASATGGTATYLSVASAPAVTLSASTVAFGSVTVGNASAQRSVTLSNSGTAALTLGQISKSGSASFTLTHDCPASLAVSSSCTLTLGFTPTAAGGVSGSVSISSNASSSPDSVRLSGTGATAATALLAWSGSTSALSFASITVGSASAAQTLTLLNQGSVAASLSTLSASGTDAGDFNLGGTCPVGGSLAANGSCTVTVTFSPGSAGSKSASLQVTASNASNPASVALSGTATAATSTGTGTGTGTGTTTTTTTTATGATDNSNVGGGGCSLLDPSHAQDTLTDPLLWALVAGAASVLWRRRREARARVSIVNPSRDRS